MLGFIIQSLSIGLLFGSYFIFGYTAPTPEVEPIASTINTFYQYGSLAAAFTFLYDFFFNGSVPVDMPPVPDTTHLVLDTLTRDQLISILNKDFTILNNDLTTIANSKGYFHTPSGYKVSADSSAWEHCQQALDTYRDNQHLLTDDVLRDTVRTYSHFKSVTEYNITKL